MTIQSEAMKAPGQFLAVFSVVALVNCSKVLLLATGPWHGLTRGKRRTMGEPADEYPAHHSGDRQQKP